MSYGSVADLDAYWVAHGYSVSGLDEAAKTAAMVKASAYVDGLGYKTTSGGIAVPMWPGKPTSSSQIDEWPRTGAQDIYGNDIAEDHIPTRIFNAVYEVAFASASGVDLNRSVSADQVVVKRKVDVLEVQYAQPSANGGYVDTRPMFPAVNALISPLLIGGADNPYGLTLVVG